MNLVKIFTKLNCLTNNTANWEEVRLILDGDIILNLFSELRVFRHNAHVPVMSIFDSSRHYDTTMKYREMKRDFSPAN